MTSDSMTKDLTNSNGAQTPMAESQVRKIFYFTLASIPLQH